MVNTNDRNNNKSATTVTDSEQLKSALYETATTPSTTPTISNHKASGTKSYGQNAANTQASPATGTQATHHSKLIPIQSVLHTESHHQHSTGQQLALQNTHTHLGTAHLNAPTNTLQQYLGTSSHGQLPTELPQEDEERLGGLFKSLDRDGNGRIDIHDLSEALREFGLSSVYAEKFLEHSDKNQSGDVGLAEFLYYVREHEKNLRLQFSHLDKNKDGKVDLEELIDAFKDLGIEVDTEEAKNLLLRMDQDGSLNISFDEWRDFLLLAPSTDIHDLIKFWRHSTANSRIPKIREVELAVNSVDVPHKLVWFVATLVCCSLTMASNFSLPTLANIYYYVLLSSIKTLNDVVVELEINMDDLPTYLDIGEDLNVPDDFTQSEMQSGMWWRHLAAGGIAGAVSRTCTAPLDRIKVFLQVQTHKVGISDSLRYMLKEGGMRSLWRGNGINVLKIAPESAIKFAAYEKIKRLIRGDEKRQMTIGERFMAGAAAGGISQTIIYPMEVLKTRLALRKTGQYSGILDAAKKIYLGEGLRSFYRGYIPNMLGIIPYAGIDLAVYETLKKKYLSSHNTEQPSFLVLLACGSASSTLGQVCSYPLALVRTRLQAQVISKHKVPAIGIPLKQAGWASDDNMLGVFRKILRTEGICGLYRGITPNFIKVLPAVSISYVVYEYSSRALGVNMT